MATRKCCHTGKWAGTATVKLGDRTERKLSWCELHLEWARDELLLLVARSAFPGSKEIPQKQQKEGLF